MKNTPLTECVNAAPLVLTEGAVGQRLEREFHLKPDADIVYAPLIYEEAGREALSFTYRSYLAIAEQENLPLLLMTNTRRANRERVERSRFRDRNVMRDYARFLREIAAPFHCATYIGGMMGSRGDAYSGAQGLSMEEAMDFHAWQAGQFDLEKIDFLFAGIMPTLPEATGMARVMERTGKPYIISLMINDQGTLLDGHLIDRAIHAIDQATQRPPLGYMTNCVHPTILLNALNRPGNRTTRVRERFLGIQANAGLMDPAALDGSAELITSEPEVLADAFSRLHSHHPLKIYGGCCGTDDRHIRAMVDALHHTIVSE